MRLVRVGEIPVRCFSIDFCKSLGRIVYHISTQNKCRVI